MKDIIEILKQFGELEYWTRPAREEFGGSASRPPIIRWRYKTPSSGVADFFRRAVASYRGTIAWDFSVNEVPKGPAGRTWPPTWVLLPARIREYSESHENLGGLAVAEELTAIDPDFGQRANAELPLLAEHIEHQRIALADAGGPVPLAG